MSTLTTIEGIGPVLAEKLQKNGVTSVEKLLEAAGVDTVPELSKRNGPNLAAKMAEVEQAKKLGRKISH